MRILPLLPILCAAPALAAPPIPPRLAADPTIRPCAAPDGRTTATTHPGKVRKLGDLPPANHYLAVDRRFGGCRVPIVISTGIGER